MQQKRMPSSGWQEQRGLIGWASLRTSAAVNGLVPEWFSAVQTCAHNQLLFLAADKEAMRQI